MSVELTAEACSVNVCLRVKKPISEVFSAVTQSEKMCQYFTSSTSDSITHAGQVLQWVFADMGAQKEVTIGGFVENEKIIFDWNATGEVARAELSFTAVDENCTLVRARESGWPLDINAVSKGRGQTFGWTHFLFCLKGYVEYGINLRAGSVTVADMMQK